MYYPKWFGGCSSLRTQRCKNNLVRRWNWKPSSFTRVTSCESYESSLLLQAALIINITKGKYGCSLFGIHSNILGSSLLVFLCRALFASFLSRYTLTSIVPTNDQFMSCPLSSQVERVIHTIPCIKQSKICKRCPTQVTWKVKFKCQICLSCLSWFSCLSWWPWWPWRAWLQW